MNKQQLQQEIEALQKQLEEKQKALAAMPEKWEPKGGEWWIDSCGQVCFLEGSSKKENRDFGNEYETEEQAEKAVKAMRAHNRLLAYVAEFAPDYDGEYNSLVTKRKDGSGWDAFINGTKGWAITVYMPHDMAVDLASKLNSGEVEL